MRSASLFQPVKDGACGSSSLCSTGMIWGKLCLNEIHMGDLVWENRVRNLPKREELPAIARIPSFKSESQKDSAYTPQVCKMLCQRPC